MTTPLDIWFGLFATNPAGTWRDYVAGRLPIPGYERAGAADTLHWVFGVRDPKDPLRQMLDKTLVDWFDEFLIWDDTQRRQFGLSRYVLWLVEVMNAASLLKLPEFTRHVYDNLIRYRGTLTPLLLAPHRDPLAALYGILAGSEECAPSLKHFWLRLCQEADLTQSDDYVEIALQGLRQLPIESKHTPYWLVGLACWLPRARSKDSFVNTFRMLRAMYPRTPAQWRDWVGPLLENLKARVRSQDRLSWWQHELGEQVRHVNRSKTVQAPHREDLERVFDQYQKSPNWPQLRKKLEDLLQKHENYLGATGDYYHYVRAISTASNRILNQNLTELLPMALQWTRRALVVDPWNITNWHIHGRCLAATGQYQSAEYVYWETLRRKKDDIQSMVELSRLMVVQDRYDEAETLLRRAFSINPDDRHVRNALGLLMRRLDRLDEAEHIFQESDTLFSWDPFFKQGLDIVRAQKRGEPVPPIPEPNLHHNPRTAAADSITNYEPLQPAAMAKRHDFFMAGSISDEENPLRLQAQEGLTALVRSDGHQAAVRFYGRRHGLIQTNEENGDLQWACQLDRADCLEPAALQYLAKQLPTRLASLVNLAAGATGEWEKLTAWHDREDKRQTQSGNRQPLPYLDHFLWEKVAGWLKETQEPPPLEKIFPVLKEAAEIVTPAATEFLVA